jgi:L-ribulose-5-phosphate 4-epimerase
MEIPALGTTHADTFYGPVPCTAPLTDEAIGGRYVHETGVAIVRRFAATAAGPDGPARAAIDPLAVPGCLVAGHGPFAWGRDAAEAAHNAVILEYVARMAYRTLTLKAEAGGVSQALLDRHYFRKHGPGASYGQG